MTCYVSSGMLKTLLTQLNLSIYRLWLNFFVFKLFGYWHALLQWAISPWRYWAVARLAGWLVIWPVMWPFVWLLTWPLLSTAEILEKWGSGKWAVEIWVYLWELWEKCCWEMVQFRENVSLMMQLHYVWFCDVRRYLKKSRTLTVERHVHCSTEPRWSTSRIHSTLEHAVHFRDVRKPNFRSVSVSKNPNRSQKVKLEISVYVTFLKTEFVSYKQSIFEPLSQSFDILHVTDTVGQ